MDDILPKNLKGMKITIDEVTSLRRNYQTIECHDDNRILEIDGESYRIRYKGEEWMIVFDRRNETKLKSILKQYSLNSEGLF